MDNRMMIELAAHALGIKGFVCEDWHGVYFCTPSSPEVPGSTPVIYHWLDDDADAFRLAVALCFRVLCTKQGQVYVWLDNRLVWCDEAPYQSDEAGRCTATRRAIVCAAAALGKEMV